MDDEHNPYQKFGLTRDMFLELVHFYRELIRLDEAPTLVRMNRRRLIRILKLHLKQLKEKKREELLQQLRGLEKI